MHTRNNFSIFSLILEASARLISTMMRQLDTVLILVTITALLRGGAPQEEANCFLCESLAGGEKKIPEISTVLLFNTVGQNCIHISANWYVVVAAQIWDIKGQKCKENYASLSLLLAEQFPAKLIGFPK